jgi:hypothetical protein
MRYEGKTTFPDYRGVILAQNPWNRKMNSITHDQIIGKLTDLLTKIASQSKFVLNDGLKWTFP